jgi:hypothetical protein
MVERTIFIHSAGWRTGSTYLWNKFRELPNVTAFCEPLNEALSSINENDLNRNFIPSPGHPENMKISYFEEYRKFLKTEGGVELFRPDFSHHNYFENDDLTNQPIYGYLKNLIEGTEQGQRIVFAFNRSVGRFPWFKRTFPSVHIFQHRNPKDQWISMQKANMIPTREGLNYESSIYLLNGFSKIFDPIEDNYFKSREEMNYFFFMYFHHVFKKIGLKYADLSIDMNEYSSSPEKKRELQKKISGLTGLNIDFSDLDIKRYSSQVQEELCYSEIDKKVLELTNRIVDL